MVHRRATRHSALVAGGGVVVALLASASLAHAHGEAEREVTVRSAPAGPEDETSEGVEEEPRFKIGIDFVFGFGKTAAADQIPPGSLSVNPINQVDADPIHTDTFIFDFGYDLTKNFGLGVRVPLTLGTISPDSLQSRTVTAFGNVELEAEYESHLSPRLKLVYSLGVALPTASGTRVPDATSGLNSNFDQDSLDRYSMSIAAAAAHGYEENALFLSNRLGIIPKLTLEYEGASGLRLAPYVKVENLISTATDGSNKYIGELVIGGRAGYLVNKYVEPGVRIWTTLAFAGDSDGSVAVVEPDVFFHVGQLMPYVGMIIPFAGSIAKEPSHFVGVRLGASLAF
jgi:hypothetical protein